jgi:hypothetical protein
MKFLILSLFFVLPNAKASCLQRETSRLSSQLVYQKCQMTEPLHIITGSFYYPEISKTALNVEYWRGSFTRENLYQIDGIEIFTDTCAQKEVYRKKTQSLGRDFDDFKVINPNLDPKIKDAPLLRALTEQDAQAAFQKLKLECQNLK